jgi:hypothetical protein
MAQSTMDGDDGPNLENVPLSVRAALRVAVQAPDSYGFILFLLLVSFVLGPLVAGPQWLWIRAVFQAATLLFALHTSRVHRRTMRVAAVLCAVAVVLALVAVTTGAKEAATGALQVIIALLLAFTVPAILRRVLTTEDSTTETILGVLDVYIIFGMFFGAVYAAIDTFSATPFFGAQAQVTGNSYQFFSFVTLTTVGYGNLVPATQIGQSLAVLEALLGQIYLVTLVASLVGRFHRGTRRQDLARLAAERKAGKAVEKVDVEKVDAESDTDTLPSAR